MKQGLITILLVGCLTLPLQPAWSQTSDRAKELQAEINRLNQILTALVKLIALSAFEAEALETPFSAYLTVGSRGDEVIRLQSLLAEDSSLYPTGEITGYFGPLTEAAVKRFQIRYGISPEGIVGPMTRAKLNQLWRNCPSGNCSSVEENTPNPSIVPAPPESTEKVAQIENIEAKGGSTGVIYAGEKAYLYGVGLDGLLTLKFGVVEPRYVQVYGTSDTFAEFIAPDYPRSIEVSVTVTNSSGIESSFFGIKIETPAVVDNLILEEISDESEAKASEDQTKNETSGITSSKAIADYSDEEEVRILAYEGDAMEPYISRDGEYLFFNNHKGESGKDLFYATKVNNRSFQFQGEIEAVNTDAVDGNPTMDSNGRFYFISTRDYRFYQPATIFSGNFSSGKVFNLTRHGGPIDDYRAGWLNMGVEITADGKTMYYSSAKFKAGETFPSEGNIRIAEKVGEEFQPITDEAEILANVNNDSAIQYAGEVSDDQLELFYSEVDLNQTPPKFRLLHSIRQEADEPFSKPTDILAPFADDEKAFVEAPTLTSDGKYLYYHKLDEGKFKIFRLTRKD